MDKESTMEKEDHKENGNRELKKLLAGLSIATLIGGIGLTQSGCATTGTATLEHPKEGTVWDGNVTA